ncbi:MAG: hypothetical protein ACKOQ3_11105 [Novosphingobium sp.]
MADGPSTLVPPADPLVAALAQLAERFGVPFSPAMLAGLALDTRGRLPLHQAEPALEVLGLNCDAQRLRRLPHRPAAYPALVSLGDDGLCVVHELRDKDALVWRPETGAAQWEPLFGVEADYSGWMATVFGDPSAIRAEGQPWEVGARSHWF